MKLPVPPPRYDVQTEARRNLLIEQEAANNRKANADVIIGSGQRLILISPNGTKYKLLVSNAGVLSTSTL
jgi:hypothetical protein